MERAPIPAEEYALSILGMLFKDAKPARVGASCITFSALELESKYQLQQTGFQAIGRAAQLDTPSPRLCLRLSTPR